MAAQDSWFQHCCLMCAVLLIILLLVSYFNKKRKSKFDFEVTLNVSSSFKATARSELTDWTQWINNFRLHTYHPHTERYMKKGSALVDMENNKKCCVILLLLLLVIIDDYIETNQQTSTILQSRRWLKPCWQSLL